MSQEALYHSKKDRVFVRAIAGAYNLKDELARLRAQPRVRRASEIKFVADFVGLTNFLDATVDAQDAGHDDGYRVHSTIGQLSVTSMDRFARGDEVLISVRPEDIELFEQRPDGANVIEGKVDFKVFLGEYMDYQIMVGDRQVLARTHPSFKSPVGDTVYLRMDPRKCITIQDNTQYRKAA